MQETDEQSIEIEILRDILLARLRELRCEPAVRYGAAALWAMLRFMERGGN